MSNQVQVTQSSTPSMVELSVQGPQGPQGSVGPAGPAGASSAWQQGTGAPSSGVGGIGDFYLNTSNGDIYGPKTSGGWGVVVFNIAEGQQGPAGPAGATGPQGPAGAAGAQGPAGPTGATGPQGPAGATGAQGAKGDSGDAGPVGATGPQGPAGATGPAGAAGLNGKTVLSGSGAPGSGVGTDGDFYIDTAASRIYGPRASGAWGSGTSLVGPAGATGSQGPAGPAGAVGAQGPAGVVAATAPLTYDAGTQTVAISAATTSAAGSMSAADKTKLDGVAAGATANATDAQLLNRANHTGTQTASTISDLGTFATANAATPPAIGGTTPAAGSFTALTASTRLGLPSGAPAGPAARDLYAVSDTLRYRDSGGVERLLLNATDNLANLANAATARSNLGAAASGAIGSSGLTMATARLLGRSTAGTGALEELTLPTGFDLSGGALRAPAEIGIACSDETSNLTTGTAKVTLRMPYSMTLTAVRLNVNTAPTGSALVVNIKEAGVTIFSTKPQIDAGSRTSVGSGTPAVISDTALADDAEITIDIDQIGSTVAGKGLKVWLIGRRA